MNDDLVAVILDHECAPENPYYINLHCCHIQIDWKRVENGYDKEGKWIYGKYEYTYKVI